MKVQEQAAPMSQKTSQWRRRQAWLNREIRLECRKEKGPWKKEQATQEDYKDVFRICREKSTRAEDQLEIWLLL